MHFFHSDGNDSSLWSSNVFTIPSRSHARLFDVDLLISPVRYKIQSCKHGLNILVINWWSKCPHVVSNVVSDATLPGCLHPSHSGGLGHLSYFRVSIRSSREQHLGVYCVSIKLLTLCEFSHGVYSIFHIVSVKHATMLRLIHVAMGSCSSCTCRDLAAEYQSTRMRTFLSADLRVSITDTLCWISKESDSRSALWSFGMDQSDDFITCGKPATHGMVAFCGIPSFQTRHLHTLSGESIRNIRQSAVWSGQPWKDF